jgi:hypothetical protein
MKRFAAAVVACLMMCSATMAADKDAEELDAQITRFLVAIDFGKMMKGAILGGIPEGDRGDPTVRALTQLPEQRYAAAAASIFRSEVSLENARKIAQFYTSETMRKVHASQNAKGVDAAVVVTPAEYAEYQAFMKTEPGRAAVRIAESFGEPQFQEKFLAALDKEISK